MDPLKLELVKGAISFFSTLTSGVILLCIKDRFDKAKESKQMPVEKPARAGRLPKWPTRIFGLIIVAFIVAGIVLEIPPSPCGDMSQNIVSLHAGVKNGDAKEALVAHGFKDKNVQPDLLGGEPGCSIQYFAPADALAAKCAAESISKLCTSDVNVSQLSGFADNGAKHRLAIYINGTPPK